MLRETSALDGSYSASNAYGASRIVNKTKNTQITLWQQRAYGAHNAFPENELGSVADFQVGPEQARLLKKSLKFAVSFRPKPPYREIFWDFQRPEIDDPRDITTINKVVHADIQCGFFYDLTGKVFGTIVGR